MTNLQDRSAYIARESAQTHCNMPLLLLMVVVVGSDCLACHNWVVAQGHKLHQPTRCPLIPHTLSLCGMNPHRPGCGMLRDFCCHFLPSGYPTQQQGSWHASRICWS